MLQFDCQEDIMDENPYEPPEKVPQIQHMSVHDFLIFLFFTVGLGFCLGVVTTVCFLR